MKAHKCKGEVVPATAAHCEELIRKVPEQDNRDMLRGWGLTSAEAIRISFKEYSSFAILANGEVVGLFGCTDDGSIWLMRGEGIEAVAVQFIRQAQKYFDEWLVKYGRLSSIFSKDYDRLLRFMEWSGFAVTDLGNGYVRCERCV